MRLILTGATGFAGGEVLRQALADPEVTELTVLTRRPLGRADPKLREVVLSDFLDYSGTDLSRQDACIWCLGLSQVGVSEARYIQVTHDYAMSGARAMLTASPDLRFCFVSGQRADRSEQARSLFARIKGRTERELAELTPKAVSFRPAYIRPTRATGPRQDFARFLAPIGSLMALASENLAVDCDQLARCLIDVAKRGSPDPVLENKQIRSWKPGR